MADYADEWYSGPRGKQQWLRQAESVESFVKRAYREGFQARDDQLKRMAFSPQGLEELRDERYRAEAIPLGAPQRLVEHAREQISRDLPPVTRPETILGPIPPPITQKLRVAGPSEPVSNAQEAPMRHVETIWSGHEGWDPDETALFGAPGPVPSVVEDDEDADYDEPRPDYRQWGTVTGRIPAPEAKSGP